MKGTCTRGSLCPYRHTNISEEELSLIAGGKKKKGEGGGEQNVEQNIRDRFEGVNDPVAKKILAKTKEVNVPDPPEDKNITTLFIGGIDEHIDEEDLKSQFEKFGKIRAVKLVPKSDIAFLAFHAREAAEDAIGSLYDRLFIHDKRMKLLWAKN